MLSVVDVQWDTGESTRSYKVQTSFEDKSRIDVST